MAAIKPIQSSVCTNSTVWNTMCEIASEKPTNEQIIKANLRSQKFSKVFKK
jgi:hypothetical protein